MSNYDIKLLKHFYLKPLDERQLIIQQLIGLKDLDFTELRKISHLTPEMADKIGENVIGTYDLPFGIATNFLINGKDYLIPMVTEEPSVIAAASNGAKMAKKCGGFTVESVDPLMVGQIQVAGLSSNEEYQTIADFIGRQKAFLLSVVNESDPKLIAAGGGAIDLDVRQLQTPRGIMGIIEVTIHVGDAMGANIVNTMVEKLAENLRDRIPGEILLRIVSNAAFQRKVRVTATFDKLGLGGEKVVDSILDAWAFAQSDQTRAVTHNKGIMNGIVALATATGNDTRAIEAACHSYAAASGSYRPLTSFSKSETGDLDGLLEEIGRAHV